MPTLPSDLRNQLERVVIDAREIAEQGARAALEALAVHHHEPYGHMDPAQRRLRNQLRARARQLGDRQDSSGRLAIGHLAGECAYEHWHRMLFARFLAENDLLIEPEMGVAITLEEAAELAREENIDVWAFASRCAQRMLPQIFRPEDPLLQVAFATEHRIRLEKLLDTLPPAVFTASDALGWVYQFWQSRKKDQVNKSEVKIGADEISAVTQLFTEPYMVEFLLHNTLGAWWAGKVAAASSRWSFLSSEEEGRRECALPGLRWDYLRFIEPQPVGFYRKDDPIEKTVANLPHWRQDSVTYFVTFRTADSLPQERLQQWLKEKEDWLAGHPEPRDADAMKEYYERFPERIEHWLDQGHGACQLKQPAIRKIVEDALRHFDGQRYSLDEFTVAGNHVHVLLTPKDGHDLSDILHSWKSFTANAINKHLGQSGAFWQKESFDHIVRSEAQLERIREYITDHEEKRQDAASTLRPAAGTFDGWPDQAKDIKVLDPCCGSGHFLVAGLHHLVPVRQALEGLSAADAVEAVLRDNLHGLEIDERCCQIAAFALAFEAWKISGWKPLPPLNIACTGIGPQSTQEQWVKLAEESGVPMPTVGREAIRNGLLNLHRLFSQAPTLGSLINPAELPADLIAADYETIQPYLTAIRAVEKADDETRERAIAAAGMVKAADLMAGEYTLVITNVPYLGRNRQHDRLKVHLDEHFKDGKADLATAFVLRCLELCAPKAVAALVTPHNWLFLTTYKKLRESLLKRREWNLVSRLGPGAFEGIGGHVVNVALPVLSAKSASASHVMCGIDVSDAKSPREKAGQLRGAEGGEIILVNQSNQLKNPDAAIDFTGATGKVRLSDYATAVQGIGTGDLPRYLRRFWEVGQVDADWQYFHTTPERSGFNGHTSIIHWQQGLGPLAQIGTARKGLQIVGKEGIAVAVTGSLEWAFFLGTRFDCTVGVLVPNNPVHLPAIAAFASDPDFPAQVRGVDQALSVTEANFLKVPFDLAHWQKVAAKKYPDGLPEPESDDPTQWLFHGWPGSVAVASSRLSGNDQRQDAAATLQVAVARLLGYRWPAEQGGSGFQPLSGETQRQDAAATMRLSKRARALVAKCEELVKFADKDGIVCIPAVRGEEPAADRLLKLLDACGGSGILPLQSAAGSRSHLDLDDWLRNGFFEEHCKLFHDRPFVWHIWDGRKRDGFHALVNYHKLCGVEAASSRFGSEKRQDAASTRGRRLLESLTYAYLGDWINRQKDGVRRGEGGAEDRLAAAVALQDRLKAILAGEPPFDIFVRWKPLHEQPIGWEPDINDGVRVNIRPFLASDLPGGRTGAGILRWKPNIKWTKDRGKEPDRPKAEYPWFWGWDEKTEDFAGGKEFDGNRHNACHYSTKVKQAARDQYFEEESTHAD